MRGFIVILFVSLFLSGCSVFAGSEPAVVEREVQDVPVPGTVYGAWTEQMIDDPKVPGALDPEGHYYRLPHRTLVDNGLNYMFRVYTSA